MLSYRWSDFEGDLRQILTALHSTWTRLPVAALALGSVALVACAPTAAPAAPSATNTPAAAAQPDQAKMKAHFEGRTIELYIGYAPGGGNDIRGRIFAEHFGKYIPGNPKVTVVNLAGGGGLTATRQAMRAKPDGLTMVSIPGGIFVNELLGDDQEGFEVNQPLLLGNYEMVSAEYTTLLARTQAATSWEQISAAGKQGRRFKYGAPSPGNTQALAGEWLNSVGAPIDVVYGYGGTNELLAAMDRQEIDLYNTDGPAETPEASYTRIQQGFPNWLTQSPKFVTPVLSSRTNAPQAWLDPIGWQVPPNILDVVETSPVQKEAYKLAFQVKEAMDPLSVPPGTPDDVYQALKTAMKAAAEAPETRAAMVQRGFPGGYRSPEEMKQGVSALEKASPEQLAIVRRMYTGK